ncbi:polar amino acid ABC transporter substrate-binding protein [Pseudoroseomonas rhizosphaerae]|uniref:Polar amino acid ABC transporter substrate-binding protein n=1 Tax=Teichococcus rhizosphaerae TaxID=1335062 RepID=A0A2C7AF17_9PROT|nr:transporter substrate-binding domain-containing protein [Pseudoroseomonas rhizosphaerae]PHK96263.1 polar amino acid ABC transporter substrate-binding protein [Pseudoroseomonas rhizosphaerae]
MRRLVLTAFLAAPLALAALSGAAQAQQGQAPQPLRTAVDGTFAPHAFPKLDGGVQGFNVDLFTEVARRMGRPITMDSASFSGLVPALNAGRYDFLAAPVTVTPERAENLLFTEGYLYTEFQFGIRKGTAPIKSLEDIRGKAIAVNKGSAYDAWAQKNAAQLGFTVQTFDSQPDAVQAVVAGRVFATLGGNTTIRYAATRAPMLVPDFTIKETRAHWAAPFRKDNAELRNAVENVLECMKLDGTVARLSEKWFGTKPAADDAENTPFPGYGVPGLPGHDPTPHTPRCG